MPADVPENPIAPLAEALAPLVKLASAESNPDKVGALAHELLPLLSETAESLRQAAMRKSSALAAWLQNRAAPPLRIPAEAPLHLFGAATKAQVLARWTGQIQAALCALKGILANERVTVGEWLYWHDRDQGREAAQAFYVAEQLRDCVRELGKLAALLTLPRKVEQLKASAKLFVDNFGGSRLSDVWETFGPGGIEVRGGKLTFSGRGNTLWLARDFTDALISFDYTPLRAEGTGAGTLFAFPARPVPGQNFSISAGPMPNYNNGIETYHVSLFRGGTGRTNLRRTGAGLKMCSTIQPDPCATLGKTCRVEILHRGVVQMVFVDGVLMHHYVDAGCYGAPPSRGRFGIRHFSGEGAFETQYENFYVAALQAY